MSANCKEFPVEFTLKLCKSLTRREPKVGLLSQIEQNLKSAISLIQEDAFTLLTMKNLEGKISSLTSSHHQDDLVWLFVLKSLSLLVHLCDQLVEINKCGPNEKGISPALLSVANQKAVESLLQFIVALGLLPHLEPGVVAPLSARIKSPLPSDDHTLSARNGRILELYTTAKVIIYCTREEISLGPLIISKFLSDILASLIQLSSSPQCVQSLAVSSLVVDSEYSEGGPLDMTVQEAWPRSALQHLIRRTYKPLLVRELLLLQAPKPSQGRSASSSRSLVLPPKWLVAACGRFLTQVVLSRDGLMAVVKGFSDTAVKVSQGSSEWRKFESLAGIVARLPAKATVPEYYKQICPQVLRMLKLTVSEDGKQFHFAACAIGSALLSSHPEAAKMHLTIPLFQPLHLLSANQITADLSEEQLTECINVLKMITNVCPPGSLLLAAAIKYLPILFELWVFTSGTVSHLKSPLRSVVSFCLGQCDRSQLDSLVQCIGWKSSSENQVFEKICKNASFKLGDEGGIAVFALAEGDKKYGIDHLEAKARRLVELLLSDLKASSLIGPIFCASLKELVDILTEGQSTSAKKQTPATTLLAPEDKLENTFEDHCWNHFCLYLVACLCEEAGDGILRDAKPARLLVLIASIMSVHVERMKKDEAGLEEGGEVFGDHISLTIASGLLSALLANQHDLYRTERQLLSPLPTLLQYLGSHHPVEGIASSCNELHICLATLGATFTPAKGTEDKIVKETRKLSQAAMPKGTPPVNKDTPPVNKGTPPVNKGTPPVNKGTPPVNKGTPPVNKDIPPVNKDTPPVNKDTPPINKDTPPINKGTPPVNKDTPPVNKDTPPINKDTPPVNKDTSINNLTANDPLEDPSILEESIREAKSHLIPLKAHGLRQLAKLLYQKDTLAVKRITDVLSVFTNGLSHPDSFVYLAAVEGLVGAVHSQPHTTIPLLVKEFTSRSSGTQPVQCSEEMGRLQKRSPNLSHTMHSVETRLKIGEALMKAARNCGETLPVHMDHFMQAVVCGIRDDSALIRASSLSNLGELCRYLHYSLPNILHEALSVIKQVLQVEVDEEVKRASLLVIKSMLGGLGTDTVVVLQDILLDLYRTLKAVENQTVDELTKDHALDALAELDEILRSFLFPEQNLTKKISVLDFMK